MKKNILENEKKSLYEEFKLKTELEINKIKNKEDKDQRLFENEYNKKAQLFNQELEKKNDENMLNIMMAQMMMAQMMGNNTN